MEASLDAAPPSDPRPSKTSPSRPLRSRRASSHAIEVDVSQLRLPREASPSPGETAQANDTSTIAPHECSNSETVIERNESSTTERPVVQIQPSTTSSNSSITLTSFLKGVKIPRLLQHERMIVIGVDSQLVIQATNDFTTNIMGVQPHSLFGELKADPYVADHIIMIELMIQECLRGHPVEGVLMRMELSEEVHLNYLIDVYPQYNDSHLISGVLITGRNMDEIFKNAGANHLLKAVTSSTPPVLSTKPDSMPPSQHQSSPPPDDSAGKSVISVDNVFQKKLIRTLSHDVRAPFKVILSGLKFLETELYDKLSFAQSDLIQDLKQSCKDTSCILQNIITFEKHMNHILIPNLQSFHLYPLLDECISFFQHSIKVNNIQITVQKKLSAVVAPEGPLLKADKNMLYETLLNLMHNAIRFSPYNSEVIIHINDISAETLQEDNDDTCKIQRKIRIEVADTGPGIPPSRKTDIFNTPELSGEGKLCLGMRCSKLLMDAMGGKIGFKDVHGFDDTHNHGATFFLEIPMILEKLTGNYFFF